jgi:hypothetical protein
LARIGGLNDPNVLLAFVLLELLVVVVEVAELLGQDVSVRCQIKGRFTELLLHTNEVEAKTIFARNLI